MRSFTALVNPISGDGRAAGRLLPLARQIREAGATVSVEYTRSLEHARAAAREAAGRGDVVIAIGGDGLVGHIAGEVVKADGTFAIIAAGRGNDFARQLGLPTENDAIAKLLLEGEPRIVDVLETGGVTVVGSLFAGVDSVTNARVNESRWIPGRFVYPYSALRTVPSWQPVAYEITVDGELTRANGFTVIAANSGYYGRGIHIAPDARVDDGLLDVVIIDQIARRDLPGFLLDLRAGHHLSRPEVTALTGRHVRITADRPLPVYGDGDPVSSLPLEIDLRPGALRILAPPV